MTASYHLTIIGTRFPHLALGVLLAKRGAKVLIVDTLDSISNKDNPATAGYRFRRRPVPLFGMEGSGFLRRFLDEIGIGQMLVNKAYSANPVSYQVVLPRHRIDVFTDRKKLLSEIAREFPDSVEKFSELYTHWDAIAGNWYTGLDDLHALEKGWLQAGRFIKGFGSYLKTRKLGDPLEGLGPGPERDFCNLQNYFLGAHIPSAPLPALSSALVQSIGRRGTYRENMGTFGLRTLLIQRFLEYGGEVRGRIGITGLEAASRDRISLSLTDGSKIQTRTLSTTEGIAADIPGLGDRKKTDQKPSTPAYYPIRFYIGLDERYVPLGMKDDLFMMREDNGGPMGLRSLYLALGPANPDCAPQGKRALTVTALTSEAMLRSLTLEFIQTVKEDLLQALESVIPFLSEGLDIISSDLEPGVEMKAPRPIGAGITGWNPDIMSRMRITKRLRGKFIVIAPTPWELGIEGEAMTALTAAGILVKTFGREI